MLKCFFLVILSSLLFLSSFTNSYAKSESWYTYWGLGYANMSYPKEMSEALKSLKDLQGYSHISIMLDLLGFYWPLPNNKTIAGLIVNSTGDLYTVKPSGIEGSLQYNTYLYSVSGMHFFGNEVGDGFFLRGDAGLVKYALVVEGSGLSFTATSKTGYGFGVGAGYGIPVSEETRILINLYYTYRKAAEEKINSFQISVGGLF